MSAGVIEHAAWTQGDAYLDKPIKDMLWYQQVLLDVVAVLSVITAGLVMFAVLCIKLCFKHMQKHAKMV